MTTTDTCNRDGVLPDTLADLLDAACDDMMGLEREFYRPNGLVWHRGIDPSGPCEVCLGGAMLAGTLKLDQRADQDEVDAAVRFGGLRGKLKALDAIRRGAVCEAARHLYGEHHPNRHRCDKVARDDLELMTAIVRVADFANFYSWDGFDAALPHYRKLADHLRANNL